jgi:shikimate dehydrogenase
MKKQVKILGFPLGHSISPAMQNAAFKANGLDWEYSLYEVAPKELEKAITLLRETDIIGFNVTIPHKEAVIPLLDDVSGEARQIGAVNTVVNNNGELVGFNTDGTGFILSLLNDAKFDPKGKKAVVIGAGGASRAVSNLLMINQAASIVLTDVVEHKAKDLAKAVNGTFVKLNSKEFQTAVNEADLLVNATPIGMHPKDDQMPIDDKIKIPDHVLVYDLVYNPAQTKLMKKARLSCSGLGMLVYQGAAAFELWANQPAPIEIMRQAAKQALFQS